jgi:hypothetical protein
MGSKVTPPRNCRRAGLSHHQSAALLVTETGFDVFGSSMTAPDPLENFAIESGVVAPAEYPAFAGLVDDGINSVKPGCQRRQVGLAVRHHLVDGGLIGFREPHLSPGADLLKLDDVIFILSRCVIGILTIWCGPVATLGLVLLGILTRELFPHLAQPLLAVFWRDVGHHPPPRRSALRTVAAASGVSKAGTYGRIFKKGTRSFLVDIGVFGHSARCPVEQRIPFAGGGGCDGADQTGNPVLGPAARGE